MSIWSPEQVFFLAGVALVIAWLVAGEILEVRESSTSRRRISKFRAALPHGGIHEREHSAD